MKLSIITPCSRLWNLPALYNSMVIQTSVETNIEWIIVYDSNSIDNKILAYETDESKKRIEIKLANSKKNPGDPHAALIRNEGLKYVTGDYIYYLDDDNIIMSSFFENIKKHVEPDKLIIFNQFDAQNNRRCTLGNIDNFINRPRIDTAQFIVPKKFQHILWSRSQLGNYSDEPPYLLAILRECGEENIKWVDKLYTYYNYLAKNNI